MFSRESDFTIANVCLSVCQSICHYAYLLISPIPISHYANQLSCQSATMPPPLSHYANQRLFLFLLATIMSVGHYIHWLSTLLSRLLSHFGLFFFNCKADDIFHMTTSIFSLNQILLFQTIYTVYINLDFNSFIAKIAMNEVYLLC